MYSVCIPELLSFVSLSVAFHRLLFCVYSYLFSILFCFLGGLLSHWALSKSVLVVISAIQVYVHVCIQICVWMCLGLFLCTFTNVYSRTFTDISIHILTGVHIYLHSFVMFFSVLCFTIYISRLKALTTHKYIDTHIHIHRYTSTHIYTYIYTYKYTRLYADDCVQIHFSGPQVRWYFGFPVSRISALVLNYRSCDNHKYFSTLL